MPGIALSSASKGRLRPSFFFICTLLAGSVLAQQPVYRCGQEYTNAPRDAARCERLASQAVTIIPGTRVQAAPAAPGAGSAAGSAGVPTGPSPARAESASNRQRDEMARAIVTTELDKTRQRHAALLQDLQKASGKPDEGQLRAAVDRAQRDIDSLQRELERRPPATTTP